MAKPSEELTKKRAERAKGLFAWWKTEHPGERKTQQELANRMEISPIVLNSKLNGKRTLTESDAQKIADYFPGVLVEYILGFVDYKTNGEKFCAAISQVKNEGDLLFAGLSAFAQLTDYEIELTSPAHSPGENRAPIESWLKMFRDGYTIHHGDKSVQLTLEEMNQFENEVCDFVELKLKHLFQRKEGVNNG